MHTVMMYGALLGASGSEAAFYLDTCPQISMFTYTGLSSAFLVYPAIWRKIVACCMTVAAAAVVALFYSALHVSLMIIAIDAYRRGSRLLAALPFALHLVFGLLVRARSLWTV